MGLLCKERQDDLPLLSGALHLCDHTSSDHCGSPSSIFEERRVESLPKEGKVPGSVDESYTMYLNITIDTTYGRMSRCSDFGNKVSEEGRYRP